MWDDKLYLKEMLEQKEKIINELEKRLEALTTRKVITGVLQCGNCGSFEMTRKTEQFPTGCRGKGIVKREIFQCMKCKTKMGGVSAYNPALPWASDELVVVIGKKEQEGEKEE